MKNALWKPTALINITTFIIHILSLIVIFLTVKQCFGYLEINGGTIQCQICQGYSLSPYKRCRKVNIVYCKLERTYWEGSKQEETQFYISSKVFARRLNSIIINRNKSKSKGKNLILIYLNYTYFECEHLILLKSILPRL